MQSALLMTQTNRQEMTIAVLQRGKKMRQIDLFGHEIDVKDLETTSPKNTIRGAF